MLMSRDRRYRIRQDQEGARWSIRRSSSMASFAECKACRGNRSFCLELTSPSSFDETQVQLLVGAVDFIAHNRMSD